MIENKKLDWPENQVLLLLSIDYEAGWIGREMGEQWIPSDIKDTDDSSTQWIDGVGWALVELTGAEYITTRSIYLVKSGEQRIVIGIPYGGKLTTYKTGTDKKRMPKAYRILHDAKRTSSTYEPVGIPEGLVVKSVADLNSNALLLAAIMRHHTQQERLAKGIRHTRSLLGELERTS